jgi:hypothetical protein
MERRWILGIKKFKNINQGDVSIIDISKDVNEEFNTTKKDEESLSKNKLFDRTEIKSLPQWISWASKVISSFKTEDKLTNGNDFDPCNEERNIDEKEIVQNKNNIHFEYKQTGSNIADYLARRKKLSQQYSVNYMKEAKSNNKLSEEAMEQGELTKIKKLNSKKVSIVCEKQLNEKMEDISGDGEIPSLLQRVIKPKVDISNNKTTSKDYPQHKSRLHREELESSE